MRMFNVDGSEGEMCGNGIRCVAKYAYDHGLSKNNPHQIETGRGVLTLDLKVDNEKVQQVTVNMGEPILETKKIPAELPRTFGREDHQRPDDATWNCPTTHGSTRPASIRG